MPFHQQPRPAREPGFLRERFPGRAVRDDLDGADEAESATDLPDDVVAVQILRAAKASATCFVAMAVPIGTYPLVRAFATTVMSGTTPRHLLAPREQPNLAGYRPNLARPLT